MRVLIVSGNYSPALTPRSFRTTELARELFKQGHHVLVCVPNKRRDYDDEWVRYGVEVVQLSKNRFNKLPFRHPFIGKICHAINRTMELLFEYPSIELVFKVSKFLTLEVGRYDLLISIASPYPIHWGVAKALSKRPDLCRKWIADCGDPYMGASLETYSKPFYFKYVEKWFCRKADYLTVPTQGAMDGYYPEFRDKIRVIPQGYNLENVQLFSGKISHVIPTFAYAGILSFGVRNPSTLLDYLIETKKRFKFVVYTCQKDLLHPYKSRLSDALELRDYVERDRLLFELSGMDFLINLDNGTSRQLPSKLIDYAIAGRPVLNVNVRQLNKNHIDEFLEGNYQNACRLPDKEEYDITNVAKKFIALADNALAHVCN